MDAEIAKSSQVKTDNVVAESLPRDHESMDNGDATEVVALDRVDHALAAKMHLVNEVRMNIIT